MLEQQEESDNPESRSIHFLTEITTDSCSIDWIEIQILCVLGGVTEIAKS